MAEISEPDLQKYFASINEKYKCWWNNYTLTDTLDRQSRNKADFSSFDSPFDFGLMVEKVEPKQDNQEKDLQQSGYLGLPVLEGIRKYLSESNHILLIGKPGSGKSTALQRLLCEEARIIIQGEKRKIPVLIELRRLDTSTSIENLIYKILRSHKCRVDKDKIEDFLLDGELLLLMDGLNELPSDEARDKVVGFRQDYPDTDMVFTTRDLVLGGNLGIDEQLKIQPLTESQIQNFIRNYFPERGEHLLRQLGNRLRELGENPFILKILCDVFESSGEIPKSKGELFRKFDSKVNNFKENQESVPIPEGLRSKKKELLSYLAFEMMQSENPQANPVGFRLSISRDRAEAILEKFLTGKTEYPWEKAKDWLEGLLKHCLLESVTSESEVVTIQFHHQLFQEYYAAEYLLRLLPNLSDRKLQRDYLNLLKWTESIAIALALLEDEAQAVKIVRLALDVDLMLGASLAGEVKEKFQEKTVDLIVKLDVNQHLKIGLLGKTRSKFAIAFIKQTLSKSDSSNIIRLNAIHSLGLIGTKKAILELLTTLNDNDNGIEIRRYVVQWLGFLKCEEAKDALINILQNHHLSTDTDFSNWISIVEALQNISPEITISIIQDKITQELGNPFGAIFYCGLGIGRILKKIDSNILLDKLFEALQEKECPNSNCRRSNAAHFLGFLENSLIVPKLCKALDAENESSVYFNILDALLRLDQEAGIKYLIQDLENPQRLNRSVEKLIEINSKIAIPYLRQSLASKINDVSWLSAVILGEMGVREATSVLIYNLGNNMPCIREIAANTLGKLGNVEAVEPLLNALNDKYYYVRRSAAIALAEFDCQEGIPELTKALRHYQTSVGSSVEIKRHNLIISNISDHELNNLGDEHAIDRWLLEISNHKLFIKIAYALAKLNTPESINVLIKAFKDDYYAAVIALFKFGNIEAIPTLMKCLISPFPDLKEELVSVISHLENIEVIQKVTEELINILAGNENCYDLKDYAAQILENIANPQALFSLWNIEKLNREESEVNIYEIIESIQFACKFYNHEIFDSLPVEAEIKSIPTTSTTIINTETVQIIENNHGNVIGKNESS